MSIATRWIGPVVVAVALAAAPSSAAPLAAGSEVPRFEVETFAGDTLTHGDLAGRVTVIEFWATWCGPCVAQLPHLKRLHERYTPQGVGFLSLSMDRAQRDAERFVEQREVPWANAMAGRLGNTFGVRSIPQAFIIGPDGTVLWEGNPSRIDEPLAEAVRRFPAEARPGNAVGGGGAAGGLAPAIRRAALQAIGRSRVALEDERYDAALASVNTLRAALLEDDDVRAAALATRDGMAAIEITDARRERWPGAVAWIEALIDIPVENDSEHTEP